MKESKCVLCGAKIVSTRRRRFCDACRQKRELETSRIRKMECKIRQKAKGAERSHQILSESAKATVATGLSYGQQVLLARQQNKDLRAFLEGMK